MGTRKTQEHGQQEVTMLDTTRREGSRLYIPALGRLYVGLADLAWLLLRLTVGLTLVPHGMQKAFGAFGGPGIAGVAGMFEKMGYPAPTLLTWLVMLTELVGGSLIAVGFLTRPAAFALSVFMGGAILTHFPQGFFWTDGGFEYPLMWGVAGLFFLIRGGGPYSVDRAIGREF
jgi:putative oxidoreductase